MADLNIFEYMYGRHLINNDIFVSLKPVNKSTGNVVTGLNVTFEIYDESRILKVAEKTTIWNPSTNTYDYTLDISSEWSTQSLGTYFIAWSIENVDLTPTIMYRIKILDNIGAELNEEIRYIGGGYTSGGDSRRKKKPYVKIEKITTSANIKPKIMVKSIEIKE